MVHARSREAAIEQLRNAARACTACPLWRTGTQTVFGAGSPSARLMLVGEQPGDQEDLTGQPFVGPAGRLLDRALLDAGLRRDRLYVTNAVKHFKWIPRGKRRLHQKPSDREVGICSNTWLEQEIATVRPELIVCLGATAAKALLGREFRVTRERGYVLERGAQRLLATVHPSSLLRIADAAERERAYAEFVADLRVAMQALRKTGPRDSRQELAGQHTR